MEDVDTYQRSGYQYGDYGLEDVDDDISYSSGEDTDSDYGADREDNDDFPDDRYVIRDPGPFRYNRKMVLVSLPCALMVLTLVGEIFLMAASFGAGVIIILDPKGEKKRCLIFFTILFVFCHGFTIYSILPLLWLSVFNLFLIGVVNMYVILTGGLCALQFAFFRKYETKLALTVEKLLFSLYPWCCVILLTWTASSVITWELVPYVFLAIGFIYLQMFMVPHTSSFKTDKPVEEEELNIVQEIISLTMAIMYCLSPSFLHLALHLIHNPFSYMFKFQVLLHLVFIYSLSIFLTTLMSVRNICEYTGWQYKNVVYARWVSGAICTALIYPVLMHYQLSSHFLPWLPLGVAIYAVYGAFLSDKKFKLVSLLTLPVPILLFMYWLTWLPWKMESLFGVEMTTLYFLLLANCVLCFLCVYSAIYWYQSAFELILATECAVFVLCEVLLYGSGLYPRSFLIITAAIVVYTLHRLHTSGKISSKATTICSSVHVTKALVTIIYDMIGTSDPLTIYRCVTMFILCLAVIKVIAEETKDSHTVKDVLYNVSAISVSIMLNSNPILHIMCIYVLWEEPTQSDIMGLCITVCGVCIIVVGSLQLPPESVTAVRQIGVVSVSLGVLILVMQPPIATTGSSLLQWGDVSSIILVAFVLLTDRATSLKQLFVCAAIAGFFPGIRMATLMYSAAVDTPFLVVVGRCALYIPAFSCLISLLFIFLKLEVVSKMMEKCILYLCSCLGVLSCLLLMLDIGNREKGQSVMSLPAWKLSMVTTGVVSVSLKILSLTQDLLIPLVEEKQEKEIPRLPFIGNVTSILTFILACVQSPVRGFLHDIWCCGATLILLCLQKDKRLFTTLRQENQIVPTIFTCIAILYSSGLVRTDLWSSTSLSFLRSFVEISTMFSVIPLFYILWGILWQSSLIMSEQLVVFLLPMNGVYLLYGSSYASQALGIVGLYAGVWMMVTKLPLIPHMPAR